MRLKKRSALACAAVLITAMTIGCGIQIPMKEETIKEPRTEITVLEGMPETEAFLEAEKPRVTGSIVVQATAIEGDTITGLRGVLTQTAAEITKGEMQGRPGVSMFTATEEIVVFTLKSTSVVMIESAKGSEEGGAEDITIGAILVAELDETGQAVSVILKSLNAGGFNAGEEMTNGTSAATINRNTTEMQKTYISEGDDENALRIDGAEAVLEEIKIEKISGESSDTENGDFYGQNAGLLALNGAQVTIRSADVYTSAVNGNGIFCYGEETVVDIFDSVIRTTENYSGGIQTTGGGTTNASNLDVETRGNSAAAIRSDRGGGTVTVDHGSYVTYGTGSPAVYCTADITVMDAALTAKASESVVVEGKNSVMLKNCTLTGNMKHTQDDDADENMHGIMIYQSMSGDADVGKASFSAEGGSITTENGDMFYVTNTDCEIVLKDVAFTLAGGIFLRVEGNDSSRGWGTEGENGGNAVLITEDQKIDGNILVDEMSSLDFTMKDGTVFTGAVNPAGRGGTVNITMEQGVVWTLTADTYVDSINGDIENIDLNGYRLSVNE